MREVIDYIIYILAGDNSEYIGYGDRNTEGKIIIIKDKRFFDNYGTQGSMPEMPVKYLRNIPVLYGDNKIEIRGGKAYIYADLIVSSYFMLSGYEEMLYPQIRDEWGRFPGKQSFAYKCSFLDRPIVDEYRCLLEDLMREIGMKVDKSPERVRKVYLTHDVDQPWPQFTLKQALKVSVYKLVRTYKFDMSAIKKYFGQYDEDFLESFYFFGKQDSKIQKIYLDDCQCIYFVLGNIRKQSITATYITDSKFKLVLDVINKNAGVIGIHGSPLSNGSMEVLAIEKERIEKITGSEVTKIRNHCLLVRNADELEKIYTLGIREEFSGGYADVAGFRYGISRAVRYINPYKKMLTNLVMQPLIVMDGTLSDERYMNMSFEQALDYVKKIIDIVKKTNGDLNILWHNHMCDSGAYTYHRKLYEEILTYLASLGEDNESNKRDI